MHTHIYIYIEINMYVRIFKIIGIIFLYYFVHFTSLQNHALSYLWKNKFSFLFLPFMPLLVHIPTPPNPFRMPLWNKKTFILVMNKWLRKCKSSREQFKRFQYIYIYEWRKPPTQKGEHFLRPFFFVQDDLFQWI